MSKDDEKWGESPLIPLIQAAWESEQIMLAHLAHLNALRKEVCESFAIPPELIEKMSSRSLYDPTDKQKVKVSVPNLKKYVLQYLEERSRTPGSDSEMVLTGLTRMIRQEVGRMGLKDMLGVTVNVDAQRRADTPGVLLLKFEARSPQFVVPFEVPYKS